MEERPMMYHTKRSELPSGLKAALNLYGFIAGLAIWFWTGVFLWEWLWPSIWFFLALIFISWIPATLLYWLFLLIATALFGPLVVASGTVFKNNAFARIAIGTVGFGVAVLLIFLIVFFSWGYFQAKDIVSTEQQHFSSIEPYLAEFVSDRNHYNEIAARADRLKTTAAYRDQIEAARQRQISVERQLQALRSVVPPESLARYHQMQMEHFQLTSQFLEEVQVAYDPGRARTVTDAAYQRALSIHLRVNGIQDEMQAELLRLGYTEQ